MALIIAVLALIISIINIAITFGYINKPILYDRHKKDKYKDFRDPDSGLLKGKRK